MSIPKNKQRSIIIDKVSYEWCFSNGTLFYKKISDKSMLSVKFAGDSCSPNDVKKIILSNSGSTSTPINTASNKKDFEEKKLKEELQYKLFIWEDVLCDWSSGIMFAYARNVREARKEVLLSMGLDSCDDLIKAPTHIIHGKAKGFHKYGGG